MSMRAQEHRSKDSNDGTHRRESQRGESRHVRESIALRGRSSVHDRQSLDQASVIRIVESERSRGDDALEQDGVVRVDETCSLLSDGVERGSVDDCGRGTSSREKHRVDEGGRSEARVLSDKESRDSSDEGSLKRRRNDDLASSSCDLKAKEEELTASEVPELTT